MGFDVSLPRNCLTFARFEHLESQGKNPKLAVCRGRSLVIISYKADPWLEKITLFFKKIIFKLLQIVGVLKEDFLTIEAIKEKIYLFYFDQAKKRMEKEMDSLRENIENLEFQKQELKKQLLDLQGEIDMSSSEIVNFESTNELVYVLKGQLELLKEKLTQNEAQGV